MSPSGGVEPGESLADADRREMTEETGATLPLGQAVWRRTYVLNALDGVTKEQTETFFLVFAQAAFASQPTHDLTGEAITTARWWAVDEIAASDELFYPEHLAGHLRSLVDGVPPPQPILLGATR
jgi:8-oxo-dGTP pyrophosphatase MutT (NUDIX family)